ncbi:hypothetical protein [Agromyces sp. NPDC058126]|uniref:hypothetical protein n=1 Tax=Agromyces sp. NPDC058126 TaxID=3346350 RepID=UPI0036DEADA4
MSPLTPVVPSFRMLFPPGWVRHDPSTESERELLDQMRAKMRAYARPDLEFELTMTVKSAFRELRERSGIAIYLPSGAEGTTLVPMSITATRFTEPSGASLDGRVADLFRNHEADFLGDDRTIVRWRRTIAKLEGFEGAVNEQVNYLVPVPGTSRREAVLISTAVLRDGTEPVDEELLESCLVLSDAIVSTFAWAPGGRTP